MNEKIDNELKKILKKTILEANEFICVSSKLKQSIEKHIGKNEKISVISNMINPCFTYKDRVNKDKFLFLSIGSLIKRKGFDLLVKAFSEEFSNNDDVELIIAGAGIEKDNLNKMILKYNMKDKIRLIGQISREETLKYYEKSDCFVLASRAETYGLVYREALGVGRPIISTKHGGFTDEDWHNEYGELIDINSLEQLKNAMRKIYVNYNEFNLKLISETCLNDCSEEKVSELISNKLFNVIK